MGSNFDLNPIAGGRSDPQERLWLKLAELETRLLQLERKRDLVVTPFSLSVPNSLTYSWAGGRMWVLMAGYALLNDATGFGGYSMLANGTVVDGVSHGADAGAAGSHLVTFYTHVELISAALLTTSTTFQFNVSGSATNYSSIVAEGLLIEWPYA